VFATGAGEEYSVFAASLHRAQKGAWETEIWCWCCAWNRASSSATNCVWTSALATGIGGLQTRRWIYDMEKRFPRTASLKISAEKTGGSDLGLAALRG